MLYNNIYTRLIPLLPTIGVPIILAHIILNL